MTTSLPATRPRRMLRQLGADTVYVLFGLPLAVLSISLLVPLFAFGVGTLPLVVVGLGTPTPHPPALPPSRPPAECRTSALPGSLPGPTLRHSAVKAAPAAWRAGKTSDPCQDKSALRFNL